MRDVDDIKDPLVKSIVLRGDKIAEYQGIYKTEEYKKKRKGFIESCEEFAGGLKRVHLYDLLLVFEDILENHANKDDKRKSDNRNNQRCEE